MLWILLFSFVVALVIDIGVKFYRKKSGNPSVWKTIDSNDYRGLFSASNRELVTDDVRFLVEKILDIRKFEIDLYWKRAGYFWAFSTVTFGGFIASIPKSSWPPQQMPISLALACAGFIFGVAWHLVNQGSKYWQENWENHLDLLEDSTLGPLYKVVIDRDDPKIVDREERFKRMLLGPNPYSVSKINSLVSLFAVMLWIFFIYVSLTIRDIDGMSLAIIDVTLTVTLLMDLFGNTEARDHPALRARIRSVALKPKE